MTVSRQWHGQVKAVVEEIAEAVEKRRETPEKQAFRAFELHQFNTAPPLIHVEQTPRARAEREIHRIALTHGWGSEVTRFLDRFGVSSVHGLSDEDADQLLDHMRCLVDRAMTACDSPEDLPAR